MNKWIKSIDGTLYNFSRITTLWWSSNVSATSDYKFELHIKGTDFADTVCKCSTESDKMMIISKLEEFIKSDERLLVFPKL